MSTEQKLHDMIIKELITGRYEYGLLGRDEIKKLLQNVVEELKIDLYYLKGDKPH